MKPSYVAKLLFPDDEDRHKMDVDASKMDEEWAARPDVVDGILYSRCRTSP